VSSPGAPILVLDSGLGGLTVVKSLRSALPQEDILYFGDTARLPYGSKTKATVTGFVRQIITYLRPFNPKHVVIACNTATALAMQAVKTEFADLAITGVIEPGARAAVEAAGSKAVPLIAIIATEATARSKAYEHAIHRRRNHARLLLRPTPLLVPIIEDGRDENDPLVQLALQQYLKPVMDRGPDVLVLGCTHYPILKKLISRMMGGACRVIDSAEQCAEDVARRLRTCGLLRGGSAAGGSLRCFVTDDSPKFQSLASRFLGVEIDPPTWVTPEELAAGPVSLVPISSDEIRQAS
jgi:glutamate racemase